MNHMVSQCSLYIPRDISQEEYRQLHEIAEQFCLSECADTQIPSEGFYLTFESGRFVMKQIRPEPMSVMVDFVSGSNAHRRKQGGGLGQDFAKALGISSTYKPSIIDATAGLGRDTFVMASLGCTVLALERNPQVAALLLDGINRARTHDDTMDIVDRIQFSFGSSHELLEGRKIAHKEYATCPDGYIADVIYLDPMFTHDEKQTAKVKKDMQAFRQLVGQDDDSDGLLETAINRARCRVVVKRARKAPPLNGTKPSYAITGKSNRFDIYAKKKVGPIDIE